MEEERNTDFGLVGGALERTKAYQNSNTLSRYDGILVPNSQKTLKTFAKEHGFETRSDKDTLEDDKLLKCTVHKMIPTKNLGEFEDPTQIYLITDASGRDIGVYDKSTGKFTLNPEIAEANKKILKDIEGGEALEKSFEEPTLKDVIEKMAKGESLVLTQERAKVMVAQNNFAERGQEFDIEDEEEKALENIPEAAKTLLPSDLNQKLPGVQITEVLVVSSPETLGDDLGEDSGIRPNGGPVTIVSAINKEGLGGMNDIYVFQDDAEIPNAGKNKEVILDVMSQHKDEGVIDDFRDNEKEHVIQKIEEQVYLTETKVEKLKAALEQGFEPEAIGEAIKKEYEALGEFVDSEIDYHDKENDETLAKMDTQIDEKIETETQEVEDMSTPDTNDDITPFSQYEEGHGPRTLFDNH